MDPDAFTYENLSPRRPTLVGRVLCRTIPGVRRVGAQTRPYAEWWREENLAALAVGGPLWVVLGDSMSQGIGATSVERGWVPRVRDALAADGTPVQVLNLSFSGARTADVTDLQLPWMERLDDAPAVVTLMVGSNDVYRRRLRAGLLDRYDALLDRLPRGTLVATTPGHGLLGEVATVVEGRSHVVPVPLTFGRGEIAEDHFHPDDRAYARHARTFAPRVAAALARATGRAAARR